MMSQPDYAAVLADLKDRRAKLDTAIEAIEAIMGGVPTSNAAPSDIRDDTFFQMTILEAATKYLAMAKRTQTPVEIAEALERGGLTHSSQNLANTLYTTLQRAEKRSGEVVKVGKGWGLAEWYPGRRKARQRPDADDVSRMTGGAMLVEHDEEEDARGVTEEEYQKYQDAMTTALEQHASRPDSAPAA